MAREPLPDPHWLSAPDLCMQCGYSLFGLRAPGPCPECGARFESRCLVLAGVARSQRGGSVLRRATFWGVVLLAVVLSQGMVLLLLFAWWLAVALLALVLGGLAWLLITGPRERRGSERFVLTPSGIARIPLVGSDMSDRIFIPWDGADAFALKRISPYWRRLRIGSGSRRPGALTQVRFEAGIRCPDSAAPEVEEMIGSLLAGGAAPGDRVERD